MSREQDISKYVKNNIEYENMKTSSAVINGHAEILNQHIKTINELKDIIRNHADIINELRDIIKNHADIINQHTKIINELIEEISKSSPA